MGAIAFDTHLFVKELTEAGMPEPQAEVLAANQARLIDDKLATKQDLKELALGRDVKELETTLKHDMKELETTLKRDMTELETTLKHDMKELETTLKHDMKELETTLKHGIETLRQETKLDIAEVKRDIAQSQASTIKWLVSLSIGQGALVVALIKLLP